MSSGAAFALKSHYMGTNFHCLMCLRHSQYLKNLGNKFFYLKMNSFQNWLESFLVPFLRSFLVFNRKQTPVEYISLEENYSDQKGMSDLALDRQPQLHLGNEGDMGLAMSEVPAPNPVLPTWQ